MKIKKGALYLSADERDTLSNALAVLEAMQEKEADEIGKETIAKAIESVQSIYESYPES